MLRPAPLRDVLRAAPAHWFVTYDGLLYRALRERDIADATFSNASVDHRFNRGTTRAGSRPALYASTDRITPLFEAQRRIQTASKIIDVPGPATHLAVLSAVVSTLLDLRNDEVCSKLKTSHQELTGNWWDHLDSRDGAPTHWLGHALHLIGNSSGVIYRSKYGTGNNIFVMHDRIGSRHVSLDRVELIN
jgi:hypothetical protein